MNRRKLLGMIAALPFAWMAKGITLASPLPAVAEPIQSEDPADTIKGFIAKKVAAGHKDLYLFKNRSQQWVFQVYDPVTGNPTTKELFFMVSGLPTDSTAGILPDHLQVGRFSGATVVGVKYTANNKQLRFDLKEAYYQLEKARAA